MWAYPQKADLDGAALLRDILREENLSRITMETIQKKVVDYYHYMADMLQEKTSQYCIPRQLRCISPECSPEPPSEIGSAFVEEITAQLSMPAKPWKT